jgi:hypothetical protein
MSGGERRSAMRMKSTIIVSTLVLFASSCARRPVEEPAVAQGLADREAIEDVLNRANLGFELSDEDLFADAFAEDGIYQLDEKGPVFGYEKMIYQGRADIRSIITDRLERARKVDPKTLSYDPSTLRRYNRNSDDLIVISDEKTARHTSTWMVVMKTNVNIHISAIGRYEDTLEKRDGKWLIAKRIRTE